MNILVVDDEPLARARLRRLIEALPGHACVGEAADGVQALATCQQLRPDVVLLDIRMPGPDGLETARALAALPVPPAVVFTTAYAEFAVDAFDAGAAHYLLKPVSAERLAQALARVAFGSAAQPVAVAWGPYPACPCDRRAVPAGRCQVPDRVHAPRRMAAGRLAGAP